MIINNKVKIYEQKYYEYLNTIEGWFNYDNSVCGSYNKFIENIKKYLINFFIKENSWKLRMNYYLKYSNYIKI